MKKARTWRAFPLGKRLQNDVISKERDHRDADNIQHQTGAEHVALLDLARAENQLRIRILEY